MSELKTALEPISTLVPTLDLNDVVGAEHELETRFPSDGPDMMRLKSLAISSLEDKSICQRGEGDMTFSRVIKPEHDAGGSSVDAVCMASVEGPVHTHLKGEVCLCIPLDGSPTFEGRSSTWVVLPPGSRHRPTVKNGKMLILYWWPEGAVSWE